MRVPKGWGITTVEHHRGYLYLEGSREEGLGPSFPSPAGSGRGIPLPRRATSTAGEGVSGPLVLFGGTGGSNLASNPSNIIIDIDIISDK